MAVSSRTAAPGLLIGLVINERILMDIVVHKVFFLERVRSRGRGFRSAVAAKQENICARIKTEREAGGEKINIPHLRQKKLKIQSRQQISWEETNIKFGSLLSHLSPCRER